MSLQAVRDTELSALRKFSSEGIQRRLIRAHRAKLMQEEYQKFIYCKDDLEHRSWEYHFGRDAIVPTPAKRPKNETHDS